ncbi:HORMA domain-containing protein [Gloeopeniophorella convolvens]|nr:HORMA domain-containing protein [Gloeopeniophorella convolvens]
MQAQVTKPQELAVTAAQSLQTVQTLLRAGMGCITYLRDLLPEDNFESSLLASSNDGSISSDNGPGMLSPAHSGTFSRSANGFAVTTITRGWSEEADKLLDYLEYGIFDAVEKQYLRSFIFAIYLDPEDPNNIVEAYTFNFEYRRIPGTDVVVPIMSLGEDMNRLSLGGGAFPKDPVLLASAEGRPPTFKDVKKSLKTLIKTLIQAITQMDALPKRRYATYKAFYYPHTPESYEPPSFRPGDSEADRFFFSTHTKDEIPEKWSVGKLETGWHGVNVHVASVSAYIPPSEADSIALTGACSIGTLSASWRQAQIDAQERDARERVVVWDAEKMGRLDSLDVDAECEDDPEFAQMSPNDSGICLEGWNPIGFRTEEGNIIPYPAQKTRPASQEMDVDLVDVDNAGHTQELLFNGRLESVPDSVQLLNIDTSMRSNSLPPTQKLPTSDTLSTSSGSGNGCASLTLNPSRGMASQVFDCSLPPSDIPTQEFSMTSVTTGSDIDTQLIMDLINERAGRGMDRETADDILNTQVIPSSARSDAIESFTTEPMRDDIQSSQDVTPEDRGKAPHDVAEGMLDCDCRVSVDEECILCEGGCKKWYHIWCMGYHSARDKRLPKVFVCFHCSLRNDQNWEIIKVQNWYEELLGNFSRLALFRRAIKIAEAHKPESSSAFTKLIGCEPIVAAQLFKRLEVEGFVAPQLNGDGIALLDPKRGKKNGKSKVKQQVAAKQRYVFVAASKRGQKYRDYFNSNSAVQLRVMGMEDAVVCASFLCPSSPAAVTSPLLWPS